MRKHLALFASACLILSAFAGCGSSAKEEVQNTSAAVEQASDSTEVSVSGGENQTDESGEQTELIVFAAASMQETLTELGNSYMEENQDITVVFNFDSSGTLKTQIQEGADCDIFISAGQKQMN